MHPSNLALLAPPGAWSAESISIKRNAITTITQSELQRYKHIQELEREKKELRESFLRRLDNGAVVESGPLTVDVKETQTRRLTKVNLVRLLGENTVAGLTELIEPTTQRRLEVGDTPHGRSNRPR